MTWPEIDGEVEHRLGELGEKSLTPLPNSKLPIILDGRKSGLRGKLVMRKGDNPDRG